MSDISCAPEVVVFAITTCTYARPDHKTVGYLTRLAQCLRDQTYRHWVWYLVGDCYTDDVDSLVHTLGEIVGTERFVWHNLEEPGERGRLTGRQLWCSAGVKAMNTAIALAVNSGARWSARVDDDDIWSCDHLKICADAIAHHENCACVFTRTAFPGRILPQRIDSADKYVNEWPRTCDVGHSAMCYRIDGNVPISYRETDYPADADLWRRLPNIFKASLAHPGATPVFVNDVTVRWSSRKQTPIEVQFPLLRLNMTSTVKPSFTNVVRSGDITKEGTADYAATRYIFDDREQLEVIKCICAKGSMWIIEIAVCDEAQLQKFVGDVMVYMNFLSKTQGSCLKVHFAQRDLCTQALALLDGADEVVTEQSPDSLCLRRI